MRAIYSDGSREQVVDEDEAATVGVSKGAVLDGTLADDAMVEVPLSLIEQFDRERGPGTTHSVRNATVDILLSYLNPGRRDV